MIGNLSGPTLIVILFIVLLLFGAPKLPGLAKSLGQSMKILKKEVRGDDSEKPEAPAAPEQPATPAAPAPAAPEAPAPPAPPAPPVPPAPEAPKPSPEDPTDPGSGPQPKA
ncbi:twin-arginine translocase TatA/TatE family subunit [Leucobacter sp. CSA2]|uniref:Sec-independent protein translocase protein TatA n=1 Tax=Leucobacter edaphi TaxID=2796472 RepID=A0A934QCY6_9MICO|nr:twin-arginine translocase TatA/TatE family subunit [Leucobacter edaphi]MBK0422366.1 twin-arginine translocase TatA/TatE family subunit [Leucobacter edaphi]